MLNLESHFSKFSGGGGGGMPRTPQFDVLSFYGKNGSTVHNLQIQFSKIYRDSFSITFLVFMAKRGSEMHNLESTFQKWGWGAGDIPLCALALPCCAHPPPKKKPTWLHPCYYFIKYYSLFMLFISMFVCCAHIKPSIYFQLKLYQLVNASKCAI